MASADVASRILSAVSYALSEWFSAMRGCLRRERAIRQYLIEERGLPKATRLPYQKQPLTAQEQAVVTLSESVLRSLLGDAATDYAKNGFLRALESGDMRAFKIRLVLLKARDTISIQDPALVDAIKKGIDECIATTEALAGCKPDPSPRRLSKIERLKKSQNRNNVENIRDIDENRQDIKKCDGNVDTQPCQKVQKMTQKMAILGYVLSSGKKNDKNNKNCEVTESTKYYGNANCIYRNNKNGGVQVQDIEFVRRARKYNSTDQIIEDIEAGRIDPYENEEEICEDLKKGLLTPVEACMFTAVLGSFVPSPDSNEVGEEELEMDREFFEESEDDNFRTEDDEYSGTKSERERTYDSSRYSYNPRGFAGCTAGRYSQSGAEWNTDDE